MLQKKKKNEKERILGSRRLVSKHEELVVMEVTSVAEVSWSVYGGGSKEAEENRDHTTDNCMWMQFPFGFHKPSI